VIASAPTKLLLFRICSESSNIQQNVVNVKGSTCRCNDGVPCSVIEDTEHGHNAIGVAIGSPDVAACGSDVVHGQSNATSTLGDASTLFQRVVDALQQHRVLVEPWLAVLMTFNKSLRLPVAGMSTGGSAEGCFAK